MLIPKRYIKPEEKKQETIKEVQKVVEIKDNSQLLLAEIKKLKDLLDSKKAPKYVFSVIRDANGDMSDVVGTPVDYDTII